MNIRYINCSQFNVSELRVCFDACHIITEMVEKGEDYIILIGAPAKLSGAGGMPWKGVSYHNWDEDYISLIGVKTISA